MKSPAELPSQKRANSFLVPSLRTKEGGDNEFQQLPALSHAHVQQSISGVVCRRDKKVPVSLRLDANTQDPIILSFQHLIVVSLSKASFKAMI